MEDEQIPNFVTLSDVNSNGELLVTVVLRGVNGALSLWKLLECQTLAGDSR